MIKHLGQLTGLLLATTLMGGCTFVIKPAQSPQFTAARMDGITFTPSIQPKATPPLLVIHTSRPSPLSDSLDTITVDDILVGIETRSFWGEPIIQPVVLHQADGQPLLIEQGSNTLQGRVEAALPDGVSPKAVKAVWVTYNGITEGCLLISK